MTTRSDKWPSINIEWKRSETGRTTTVNLTKENALALAAEILKRAEAGNGVELKFMGEIPRKMNVKTL